MGIRYSESPEVVGTGLAVLDRVYADGDLAAEALGGSCANVLVSLAMLHRRVLPVLALGADETGERLLQEFLCAGADVRHISRRHDIRSPVIAQELDTAAATHRFSFTCLETSAEFPRYQPIDWSEAEMAATAISSCSIFYADRLSDGILLAMEGARSAGALVIFEPSEVHDEELFQKAVRLSSVIKFSSDRLGGYIDQEIASGEAIAVITHGAAGLEVRRGEHRTWCGAIPASHVADTCGSGDMVSVGLIDWLLGSGFSSDGSVSWEDVVNGVIAGQHLASANCAYAGARGLFHRRGAAYARRILSEGRR